MNGRSGEATPRPSAHGRRCPRPGAPRRLAAAGGPAADQARRRYIALRAAGRGRLTPARPYTTATRPGANCRRETALEYGHVRYNAPPSNRTATRGRLVLWLALMALRCARWCQRATCPTPAPWTPAASKSRSAPPPAARRAQRGAEHAMTASRDAQTGAQCPFAAGAPDARARVLLNPLSLPADTTPTAQPAQPPLPATVAHGPPLGSRAPPPGLTRTDRAALSPRALSNRPTRGFPCVPSSCPCRPARHARPIRGGAGCCCPRPAHDPGRLRPGSPKLNGMDLSGMPTGDFQLRDTEDRERRLADYRGQCCCSSASPNARTSAHGAHARHRDQATAGRRRRQLRVLFITVDPERDTPRS